MTDAVNTTDGSTDEDLNQTNIANETKASNESQVIGDGGVSEIGDTFANISFNQCSSCKDVECNFGDKTQHWTGDNHDNVFKLQDPEYTEKCPLPSEFTYLSKSKRTIDLSKIVDNLPVVVQYIRETSTSYKELGNLLKKVDKLEKKKKKFTFDLPKTEDEHTEQIDEIVEYLKKFLRDNKTVPAPYTNEIQEYPIIQANNSRSDIHFIDCEYMLKVSIPKQTAYSDFLDGKMFKPKGHKITKGHPTKDKFRWIFIPSSDRFGKMVKLDRSSFQNEGEMSRDDTLCFVVVRGNQFENYREKIGDKVPIIQLPEIVIGVGYARFWIVKIAKRFKLEHIWMIDDSVDIFKEYIPIQNGNRYEKDPDGSKQDINRRCPSYCFKKMESVMEKQPNLVAISPRKYRPGVNVTSEFTYKPVQAVMLLNITKIIEKNINFRPELRYMEDMIFSQECKNAGLQLCTWNAIIFVDKTFLTTGTNTKNQSPRGKTETREK